MFWVSLDIDWICGDCRTGTRYNCIWGCKDCEGSKRGRPNRKVKGNMPQNTKMLLNAFKKFKFTKVIVRECHASIYKFLGKGDQVLNIDYHTDDYDYDVALHCGNWVNKAKKGKKVFVWQNAFEEDPANVLDEILGYKDCEDWRKQSHKLFICTSSNYTHPSVDKYYEQILQSLTCPVDLNLNVK
jgi:hypothetical protein